MSFLFLPILAVVGGSIALAALLYGLQQLRARNTEVTVPTLIFWQATVRDAPVRIFRDRFRHWWAYLLILTICLLIWLAISDPVTDQDESVEFQILYLDASAFTANPDDFARAKTQLLEDLRELPDHGREVYFGTSSTRKLLSSGEHYSIAERRMEAVAPIAAPTALPEFLRLLGITDQPSQSTQVVVYGNVVLDDILINSLPERVSLVQRSYEVSASVNWGITSLGWTASTNEPSAKVDVLVGISHSAAEESQIPSLTVTIDDDEVDVTEMVQEKSGTYLIVDVPANGGLVTATLDIDDGYPIDNAARLRLPNLKPIQVAMDTSVHSALRQVILADPRIAIVETDEQVRISEQTTDENQSVPSLHVVSRQTQQQALVLGGPFSPTLQNTPPHEHFQDLNLDAIGDIINDRFEIGFEQRPVRSVSLRNDLLTEEVGFRESAAFPLLIARLIRWLAAESSHFPYAAVGRPLEPSNKTDSLQTESDLNTRVLGADYIPLRTTDDSESAADIQVSLLNTQVSRHLGTESADRDSFEPVDELTWDWLVLGPWLVFLAILLLALEWYLYQRRYMP